MARYQDSMKDAVKYFDEIEPRSELFYLLLKALILINKGNLPFIKIYTGKTPSDEEREEAFQLWIEGEKFSEKHNLPSMQTGFLRNMQSIHITNGELELALELGKKMATVAKEKGSKRMILWALSLLAGTYYSTGEYKQFYEIHKERLRI